MTEDTEPARDDESVPNADTVRQIRDEILPFDPTLENLVMFVALMDSAEVGVTLHVKGAVVSGMLISARRYFKVLIYELRKGVDANQEAANTARAFAEFFKPTLDAFEKSRETYKESGEPPPRPHHIHMRNVLTFVAGETEPITQTLWRGRLTEVDGWGVGNFGGRAPDLPEELW